MIQPMARVRIKPEHGWHKAEWGTVIGSKTTREAIVNGHRETRYLVRFVWFEERLDPAAGYNRVVDCAHEEWYPADWLEVVDNS